MNAVRSWLYLALALSPLACRHAETPIAARPAEEAPVQVLARYLAGSFSTASQAAEDSRFFDIRLHVVPLWPEREDGPWLYVEQAAGAKLDKPYRQRVYRLRALADGRLESQVYLLPGDALRFAGAWQKPELLAGLTPEQLQPREGCSVYLKPEGAPGVFRGATEGTACASDLRGAAYATSEVTVDAARVLSLDRGYDAQGKQVWGSEHGPYRFEREKAPAAP